MKKISSYLAEYVRGLNKPVALGVTLFTALLIFLNYHAGIDKSISAESPWLIRFALKYFLFLLAFGLPYLLYFVDHRSSYFRRRRFLVLLLVAPAIFSFKATLRVSLPFSSDPATNKIANLIVYWPLLLLIVTGLVWLIWRMNDRDQPFYGTSTRHINLRPYWLLLLMMVPLITLASTQPDFLAMYPKLHLINGQGAAVSGWQKLLYELSYGSDFFTIELFFRGFLVLAFLKLAGKDCILPMACFYCSIHFGKPLGECISSYFGGLILGVVAYETKSIWGGLLVHLGIAWLMEAGGFIGHLLK